MSCSAPSTEEDKYSKIIEKQIKVDKKKAANEVKLLLLGTGESGKSTIAKQLKILHLTGFTEDERDAFRIIIHSNIIDSVAVLAREAKRMGYQIRSDLIPLTEKFWDTSNTSIFLTPQVAKGVVELWRDPAIRQTYERRAEYQLPGSVDYLLENAERLLVPKAAINDNDILRARMRTMGIYEIEFTIDNFDFRVVDVGGQRGERKKWFHCFSNVSAVIFCVALNEYDEKLYEDHRVNRMTEAINLFKEVCNNKFFNEEGNPVSMIIFLNKLDLFLEKIKKVPLTCLFPDYKGGNDPTAASKYILDKLMAQNKNPNKLIFAHETTATDTNNVRVVFNAVRVSILKRNLSEANIM